MKEYEFIIKHYKNDKHTGTDYIGHVTPEEYMKCMRILMDMDDSDVWENEYKNSAKSSKEYK